MKNYPTHWIFALVLSFSGLTATGQNSCFSIRFSMENAQPGDTIEVAVTVSGFTGIEAYQFAARWSYADLQFIRHSTAGSPLGMQLINPLAGNLGVIRTLWSDENAVGVTLPDNSLLFKMYFKVLASNPGFYPIKIDPDNNPTIYDAENNASHRLPLANIVGGARVNMPSDFVLDTLCSTPPLCAGGSGMLRAIVSGGMPPYQYLWTGTNGFVSMQSVLNEAIPGRYYLTVTDAQGVVVQAIASVEEGGSTLYFNTTTQNAKCDAPNGCATVNIFSGLAPYTVLWSQPGPAYTSRCDLPGGEYTVTVTDSRGCVVEHPFTIDKDTLIDVTLAPVFADCRFGQHGSIHLTTNGVAPCTYQWSNGATTANLANLSPKTYTVMVEDALGCVGTASTEVKDYGTFDWQFYLKGFCDSDTLLSHILLDGYALAQRTKLPLSLSWNSGTRQEIQTVDESIVWNPMARFSTVPNGNYTVTITDAEGCAQEEEIRPSCHKNEPVINSEPIFYIESYYNFYNQVAVKAKGIKGIKKIHFSLTWKSSEMALDVHPWTSSLYGVTSNCFTISPNGNRLDFTWESPWNFGYYNDNEAGLFYIHFKNNTVNGAYLDFENFADAPVVLEHETEGEKPFIGRNGKVYFSYPSEGMPQYSDFNLTAPSCAYDGYRRIELQTNNPHYQNPYDYVFSGLHSSTRILPASELLFAKPGSFSFSSDGIGGFTVNIPPYTRQSSECVWPGDADNNSVVNHFDLLYLGLGLGNAYKPRKSLDSLWRWQGAGSEDWPQSTPKRQINFKNLDLDGNGTIEAADTATLLLNWGKMINDYADMSPYSMPALPDTIIQSAVNIQADTLKTGITVKIPVTLTAAGIQGLAFSISYNPALLSSAPYFKASDSWLGNPGTNLLQLQKDFPGQSRLDVAMTRTDGMPAEGSGIIGYLNLTFKALPPDSLRSTVLFVAHALGITPAEKLIGFAESRQELMLRGGAVSAIHTPAGLSDRDITLAPNPAIREIQLECLQSPITQVVISNADASFKRQFDWEMPSEKVQIDLGEFPAGTYFTRIFCEKGVAIKKFVLLR